MTFILLVVLLGPLSWLPLCLPTLRETFCTKRKAGKELFLFSPAQIQHTRPSASGGHLAKLLFAAVSTVDPGESEQGGGTVELQTSDLLDKRAKGRVNSRDCPISLGAVLAFEDQGTSTAKQLCVLC